MKFIKKIIEFLKKLFGFKKKVEPVKYKEVLESFGSQPLKTLEEPKKPKISFAKAIKECRDEERSNLSDGALLIRYITIKEQILRGDRSDDVILEYINELEYRGLKYEEII